MAKMTEMENSAYEELNKLTSERDMLVKAIERINGHTVSSSHTRRVEYGSYKNKKYRYVLQLNIKMNDMTVREETFNKLLDKITPVLKNCKLIKEVIREIPESKKKKESEWQDLSVEDIQATRLIYKDRYNEE